MSIAALHQRQFYAQYIGHTLPVVVNGAPQLSDALIIGARYAACCPDTDVYLRQGNGGVRASAGDLLLPQGEFLFCNTDDIDSNRISVVTATGTGGTLRLTRIDACGALSPIPVGSPAAHQAQYYSQFIGQTLPIAIGPAAVLLSPLPAGLAVGRYGILCPETDVFVMQGDGTIVADSGQFLLPAGVLFPINVDGVWNSSLSALTAVVNNTGTLRVTRLDSV